MSAKDFQTVIAGPKDVDARQKDFARVLHAEESQSVNIGKVVAEVVEVAVAEFRETSRHFASDHGRVVFKDFREFTFEILIVGCTEDDHTTSSVRGFSSGFEYGSVSADGSSGIDNQTGEWQAGWTTEFTGSEFNAGPWMDEKDGWCADVDFLEDMYFALPLGVMKDVFLDNNFLGNFAEFWFTATVFHFMYSVKKFYGFFFKVFVKDFRNLKLAKKSFPTPPIKYHPPHDAFS
jgi:hypothetical protein